jgi:hypothetical protein
MNTQQNDNSFWWKIAGGAAVYFLVIQPAMQKLGILDSAEDIKVKNEKQKIGGAFDPNMWQTKSIVPPLPKNTVDNYIDTITGSFGIFADNYAAILGVFKQLRSKVQVSYLSYVFLQNEGVELLEFLGTGGGLLPWDGLSDDHLAAIVDYANSLP